MAVYWPTLAMDWLLTLGAVLPRDLEIRSHGPILATLERRR